MLPRAVLETGDQEFPWRVFGETVVHGHGEVRNIVTEIGMATMLAPMCSRRLTVFPINKVEDFMKMILARKIGMTQIFQDDGTVVRVSVLQAGPCTVTLVRPLGNKGTNVQLGFGEAKEKHVKKPQRGHLTGLPLVKVLREFRLPRGGEVPKRGDAVRVSEFSVGEKVRISGTTKGRGFAGVVKRHGFRGGWASHGNKHTLRAPGSIGTRFPQMVVKGRRMAGRMGGERVTLKGFAVADVIPEENLLVVKGAVPGHRGTVLEVTAESL